MPDHDRRRARSGRRRRRRQGGGDSDRAHAKRIGLTRLAGVVVFAGFGVLFVTLALTGNSDTAPGFQEAMGRWMRQVSDYLDEVPNLVSLPVLAALLAGFAYAVLRGGESNERQES